MKLNHLNLPTPNVAESRSFFERYFHFTCTEVKGDGALAVLKGEDDFVLVLMSTAFNRNGNSTYPDALHIGFLLKEKEEVDHLYQRLEGDGFQLEQKPGNMRGVYGFYFNTPGNILTEVSCPVNSVPGN